MLPSLRDEFDLEKASGEATLRAKKSELFYLSSLTDSKIRSDGADAVREDAACPICLGVMAKVAFFSCGHGVCEECATLLINRAAGGGEAALRCPHCRRISTIDAINFASAAGDGDASKRSPDVVNGADGDSAAGGVVPADRAAPWPCGRGNMSEANVDAGAPAVEALVGVPTARGEEEVQRLFPGERASTFDDAAAQVSGDHLSAKVSAVVRVLRTIEVRDVGAKTLIFSQWVEVLNIVSHALSENGIPHASLSNASGVERRGGGDTSAAAALDLFKRSETTNVLLILLRRGAAGLNIVEATHVFLVEPSLNPAMEAQAVSRVHRMSQTKHTYVHRFIVNNTVEDRVRKIAVGRQDFAQTAAGEDVTADDVWDMLSS
jgi:E3 ubiquitin-protein ligase SHPRH